MHHAVFFCQYEIIRKLLEPTIPFFTRKPNVNYRDSDGRSPLMRAMAKPTGYEGYREIAALLLKHKADVNNRPKSTLTSRDETALHYAVEYNWVLEAEMMLKLDAKIDEVDKYGQTPLFYAVSHHHHELAGLLLKHGADADMADINSETPLHRAVYRKDVEMVKILIPFVKKSEEKFNGETPAEMAERYNLKEITDLIRKSTGRKSKPKKTKKSETATKFVNTDFTPKDINFKWVAEREKVIQAARENNFILVKELIERAESEESLNCIREGHSLVHYALLQEKPNKEFINYLLAKGINYTHVNYKCKTPAEIALERKVFAFFECLAENNLKCEDSSCNTPLHFAVKAQNKEMLQYLLENGYDMYAQNNEADTPLTMAVAQRYDETDDALIDIFLNKGYDINFKDLMGRTVLFRCRTSEMMERFISKGADFHMTNNSGRTLLFEFISQLLNLRKDMIVYLVEKGVDVNRPDLSGMTALDYLLSLKVGVPRTITPPLYTYDNPPERNPYFFVLEEVEQYLKDHGATCNKTETRAK